MNTQQYLNDKNVACRYQISRATVWRWSADGSLPVPIKINGVTRWILSELEEWDKQNFSPLP